LTIHPPLDKLAVRLNPKDKTRNGKTGYCKKHLSLSNPKVLIAAIFVLGFGLFGAYKVLSSSAATKPSVFYRNYTTYLPTLSVGISVVNDTNPYPMPAGTPSVLQLTNGSKLVFGQPYINGQVRTCYVIRAVSTEATVEIISYGSKKNVSLPANNTGNYSEYCLAADSSQVPITYNVRHVSGGAVNVAHMSVYK
jgi:hypothetical protein